MTIYTYHTKPKVVAAWQVNGGELAQCVHRQTELPLGLELAAYRYVAAKDAEPAKLVNYRFVGIRKRFEEGFWVVRDEEGRITIWHPKDFAEKYTPA